MKTTLRILCSILAAATVVAIIACSGARGATSGFNATSTPQPAQITRPLAIANGAPIPVVGSSAAPLTSVALPSIVATQTWLGVSAGLGYFTSSKSISAVELWTGHLRWTRAITNYGSMAAVGQDVAFVSTPLNNRPFDTLALSGATGDVAMRIPNTVPHSVLDGVLYATDDRNALSALDEHTGKVLWRTTGGGGSIQGDPQMLGSTLLQQFTDDGATLVERAYAFDARTGHARWLHASASGSLGTSAGAVYLNATWFPETLDSYLPMTIDAVDINDGTTRSSFTYVPDPQRNAQTYRQSPIAARVSDGFVYLLVNGQWYRYEADRDPNDANAVSLGNLDLQAWFDNGTILANTAGGATLAQSLPDGIKLHALGNGPVRSPVALRSDGEQYALVGNTLLAFDPDATPHAIGHPHCPVATRVVLWHARVALLCADEESRVSAEIFADVPMRPVPPPPTIAAAVPATSVVRLDRYDIPPADGFDHQWWMSGITGEPNGNIAFTLQHSSVIGTASAIGVLTRDHHVELHFLPAGLQAMTPDAVVADASGALFFNDDRSATISEMSADGKTHVVLGVASTPEPVPTDWPIRGIKRLVPGIRLATGNDGQAWYERSHPRAEIGRVDGSRVYPVPVAYGNPYVLREGSDGALWFLTPVMLGRLTLDGAFSVVALPVDIANPRHGPLAFAIGNNGTVWLGSQAEVVKMNAVGVVKRFQLPNATANIRALGAGCDGSVYVAEWAPQVDRIRVDGTVEQYPVDLSIDAFMRTPDCTIWVAAGSNYPRQNIAKFELVPAAR